MPNKPKFAANTTVSPDDSLREIKTILKRYGATRIATSEEESQVIIGFEVHERRVRLVVKTPTLAESRQNAKGALMGSVQARQAHEKAIRQRWRALLLVIKAKMEAVEAGVETFEEAFMAQLVLPGSTRTVSEWLGPQIETAYRTGSLPFLLSTGD